jgi:outer membrane biosynthesis protein TonB
MARGAKSANKETKTAGSSPQDKAEEINLVNAENIGKEEIDTVTAETPMEAGKKTKAKKEKKTKVEEVKEEVKEETTTDAEVTTDEEDTKEKKVKTPKEKKVKEPKEKKTKEPKEKEPKEPKEKKRAPSAYNIFVKEIMPILKKENEGNGKTQRDLMKIAAERWNEKKAEKK